MVRIIIISSSSYDLSTNNVIIQVTCGIRVFLLFIVSSALPQIIASGLYGSCVIFVHIDRRTTKVRGKKVPVL